MENNARVVAIAQLRPRIAHIQSTIDVDVSHYGCAYRGSDQKMVVRWRMVTDHGAISMQKG